MLTAQKNKVELKINIYHQVTDEKKQGIRNFLDCFQDTSFHQFPDLVLLERGHPIFFTVEQMDKITGFAIVIIKKSILATLTHGPIGDQSNRLLLLEEILKYLRKKHILLFRWMPPLMDECEATESEKILRNHGSVIEDAKQLNWATEHVSLELPSCDLLRSFSETHRRSIKKALQASLQVSEINDEKTIKEFADGYVKMYQHRKNKVDPVLVLRQFYSLFQFFSTVERGFFLCAKNHERLIGGVCIIYAGKNAIYYRGFTDHDYYKQPIHHLVFYEAMLKARAEGKTIFDLGGYALDVTDRQLQNINRFKDGFKGKLVTFPLTRVISLGFLGKFIYRFRKKFVRWTSISMTVPCAWGLQQLSMVESII